MIVDLGAGCVAAVLDWELATIGDPLADLGYLLTSYPAPGEPLVPTSAMGTAVLEPGYPERAELLGRYADRTGADVSGVNWYAALAMYKLAALYEYSRRRFEDGVGDPYYADPKLVTVVPGRRRAAGRCLISAEIDQMAASSRTFPPNVRLGGYTERAALAAAEAALLRSRASAQSASVIALRPAKVFGPASRWPPSIAMVSPVK